jgi:hypothetical protein
LISHCEPYQLLIFPSRLPEIRRNVANLLNSVNKELDTLPIPNHYDPRREIITVLRDFVRKVSKHIGGYPPPSFSASKMEKDNLIHQLNGAYDKFRLSIHETAPRFRPWMSDQHPSRPTLTDDKIDQMVKSASCDDAPNGSGMLLYLDEVLELAKRYVFGVTLVEAS